MQTTLAHKYHSGVFHDTFPGEAIPCCNQPQLHPVHNLSFTDSLKYYLSDFYIRRIVTDEVDVKGVPSMKVEVFWMSNGIRQVSTFTFADAMKPKANPENTAVVMRSYMEKGRL